MANIGEEMRLGITFDIIIIMWLMSQYSLDNNEANNREKGMTLNLFSFDDS